MRLDNLILNSDAPEELRPMLHTTIQPFSTDADKVVEVPVIINGGRWSRTAAMQANPQAHATQSAQSGRNESQQAFFIRPKHIKFRFTHSTVRASA
jgi:hypothetical protein